MKFLSRLFEGQPDSSSINIEFESMTKSLNDFIETQTAGLYEIKKDQIVGYSREQAKADILFELQHHSAELFDNAPLDPIDKVKLNLIAKDLQQYIEDRHIEAVRDEMNKRRRR